MSEVKFWTNDPSIGTSNVNNNDMTTRNESIVDTSSDYFINKINKVYGVIF